MNKDIVLLLGLENEDGGDRGVFVTESLHEVSRDLLNKRQKKKNVIFETVI